MTNRLEIQDLEWDSWNTDHVTRHGVTIDEIYAALGNVLSVRPSYKHRFIVFGSPAPGRVIAVVIGEVPNKPNVFYVFSARPANRRERRDLYQEPGT